MRANFDLLGSGSENEEEESRKSSTRQAEWRARNGNVRYYVTSPLGFISSFLPSWMRRGEDRVGCRGERRRAAGLPGPGVADAEPVPGGPQGHQALPPHPRLLHRRPARLHRPRRLRLPGLLPPSLLPPASSPSPSCCPLPLHLTERRVQALDGAYDDSAIAAYALRCTLERDAALNATGCQEAHCLAHMRVRSPRSPAPPAALTRDDGLQKAILALDECYRKRSYVPPPTYSLSSFANALIFATSVYTTIGSRHSPMTWVHQIWPMGRVREHSGGHVRLPPGHVHLRHRGHPPFLRLPQGHGPAFQPVLHSGSIPSLVSSR